MKIFFNLGVWLIYFSSSSSDSESDDSNGNIKVDKFGNTIDYIPLRSDDDDDDNNSASGDHIEGNRDSITCSEAQGNIDNCDSSIKVDSCGNTVHYNVVSVSEDVSEADTVNAVTVDNLAITERTFENDETDNKVENK